MDEQDNPAYLHPQAFLQSSLHPHDINFIISSGAGGNELCITARERIAGRELCLSMFLFATRQMSQKLSTSPRDNFKKKISSD